MDGTKVLEIVEALFSGTPHIHMADTAPLPTLFHDAESGIYYPW